MEPRDQNHVAPSFFGWLLARGLDHGSTHGMGCVGLAFIVKAARDFLGVGVIEGAVADKLHDDVEGCRVHRDPYATALST